MAIEIVDLPITNGDFPVRYVNLPEGKHVFFPPISSRAPVAIAQLGQVLALQLLTDHLTCLRQRRSHAVVQGIDGAGQGWRQDATELALVEQIFTWKKWGPRSIAWTVGEHFCGWIQWFMVDITN